MDLYQRFWEYIQKEKLFGEKSRLLLAVSGGLDSCVLLALCQEAGLDFLVAHANFQLRGKESERDASFVQTLGEKYGRVVLTRTFETQKYASEKKLSIQVAARHLRYAWFHEMTSAETFTLDGKIYKACDYIVTAHHQDDNIETLLMHFFRGSGISGLRGMQPRQEHIVRPLLFASREELKSFAVSRGIDWVEDSSNESDNYSRNYFRHQVIPVVSKVFPNALDNLAANLQRFRDIESLYYQSIERHKKKLVLQKGVELHIPVLKLKQSVPLPTILYEIIRGYGFTPAQVGEVMGLLDSESGKYVLSATHRVLRNRNWLIVAPLDTQVAGTILIEKGIRRVEGPGFTLEITTSNPGMEPLSPVQTRAQLDEGEVAFPLLLRKWKQGDYFYPLGMRKKKKIARFLIDSKLSLVEKERIWVIEANKKLVWVVGMRIDDRFKVTPKTKQVLNIEMRRT